MVPNGEQTVRKKYHYNSLHGVSSEWFETGGLRKRSVHELGILIESDEWDESGNLVSGYQLTEDDPNYKRLEQLRPAKCKEL
jgi:hypothetical protein